jgi:hypothetical protein
MRSVSNVPAALDALVSLVRTALSTAGQDGSQVQVLDGQNVSVTDPDVVAIGFTGTPGEAAIESTRTREQMTTDPSREAFEITSLASSWRGDDDPKQVRDRVYHFIDLIEDELQRDPTLGGVVARAQLRSEAFAQEQTNKGPVATVQFVIAVDAFTKRRT